MATRKKPSGTGVFTVERVGDRFKIFDSARNVRGVDRNIHQAVGSARREAGLDSRDGSRTSIWVEQQDGSFEQE